MPPAPAPIWKFLSCLPPENKLVVPVIFDALALNTDPFALVNVASTVTDLFAPVSSVPPLFSRLPRILKLS